MSEPTIDLSIIIPAYMEAARIADALVDLATFLKSRDYGKVEVIVVTADSPDGTAKIAAAQARLFKHFRLVQAGPRVGKGRDVRLGIFEARGRYRLFMDADLATPLHHLDDVKAFMDRGGVVGIAVRNLLVIHKQFTRKFVSKAANIAAQVLVVPGIKDTQCGFKVFEAEAAEKIFSRMTMLQWSFDMEILAIARQLHYPIEYFDTPDWKDPKTAGTSLVGDSIIKVALSGFLDPFKIRAGIWAGRYRQAHYTHKARY
ncbi:MAG TPA: glycosyltransferase [Candidatus Saccharimonadia bacterium]|nr:glycosyltransferase [Candidatus Saccharimonadia bacterium]